MSYTLVIGDRSWSLRGWLMFARFGLPVTVQTARLYSPEITKVLADFGIARTVPALRVVEGDEDFVLWDTYAMAETLAERHPDRGLWPADPGARAMARTVAAEMHASFQPLREACPMNLRRAYLGFEPPPAVLASLLRIEALWSAARAAAGGDGPWLLGAYSLADVFFARLQPASRPTACRQAPRARLTSPRTWPTRRSSTGAPKVSPTPSSSPTTTSTCRSGPGRARPVN